MDDPAEPPPGGTFICINGAWCPLDGDDGEEDA